MIYRHSPQIEAVFGWTTAVDGMAQNVCRRAKRLRSRSMQTNAAHDLARLPRVLAARGPKRQRADLKHGRQVNAGPAQYAVRGECAVPAVTVTVNVTLEYGVLPKMSHQ